MWRTCSVKGLANHWLEDKEESASCLPAGLGAVGLRPDDIFDDPSKPSL